ncbi:hypothetical protein DI392_00155 [Vibrio albus]|uniref:Uncharacterized protein n=1 Tax=Vibrio albus TaxID=2200953 RepID=A0A2U3BD91_9VIBR|nr:hypothetical protein DI392_00155 [Vibrio albus]
MIINTVEGVKVSLCIQKQYLFWVTLALYILTLCTVSYVGVYLTYIAIPLIVVSGLIMKCTKPKPEYEQAMNSAKVRDKAVGKAANSALDSFYSFMDDVNDSLKEFNQITELSRERTKHLEEQKHLSPRRVRIFY